MQCALVGHSACGPYFNYGLLVPLSASGSWTAEPRTAARCACFIGRGYVDVLDKDVESLTGDQWFVPDELEVFAITHSGGFSRPVSLALKSLAHSCLSLSHVLSHCLQHSFVHAFTRTNTHKTRLLLALYAFARAVLLPIASGHTRQKGTRSAPPVSTLRWVAVRHAPSACVCCLPPGRYFPYSVSLGRSCPYPCGLRIDVLVANTRIPDNSCCIPPSLCDFTRIPVVPK